MTPWLWAIVGGLVVSVPWAALMAYLIGRWHECQDEGRDVPPGEGWK